MVDYVLTGDKNEFGNFSCIKLDEMKARGGAGSIWTVSGQKNIVAKIYHKDVNIREYQPKIEAMISSRPASLNKTSINTLFPPYTWPLSQLTQGGSFVGYLMPKIDFTIGVSLERFLNRKSRQVDKLSNFVSNRHLLAHNLAHSIKDIHDKGHLIVDLKPQNLVVHREKYLISVLDTDGFYIGLGEDKSHFAKQFTPEYIAPEFIKSLPSSVDIQQDYFALAVLIFRLFNNGIHPFQAGMKRSNKTINEMVYRKNYAYGLAGNRGLIPSRFSEHEAWPKDLREAFDQAFRSRNRPTCNDWTTLLSQFNPTVNERAQICPNDTDHVRLDKRCGTCELQEKLNRKSSLQNNQNTSTSTPKQKNISTKNTQTNIEKRKIFKSNLIKRSIYMSFVIYVVWSIGFNYLLEPDFDIIIWMIDRFGTNAIWTLSYVIGIAVFLYAYNRGNPRRDCPNCGAYAGALKFQESDQDFVCWRYQTKNGRPDKRYKYNPKLFKMISYWHCSYCDSVLRYDHELSAHPNEITTRVTSKFVI